MPRSVARLVAVAFSLMVAACASLPPPPSGATAAPIGREMSGRLSVHYHDLSTDHEETTFANFDWTERGENVQLSLFDPLGQTVARIESNPSNSVLMLRDGRRFVGETPEALTREALGWTLPVRGLIAWLGGRSARDGSLVVSSGPDHSRRLSEDGWTILYPDAADPPDAPRRIDLSFPGPPVAIDLRIVIDRRSGS